MKRDTNLVLECVCVDSSGINTIYDNVNKRIPLYIDILGYEILVRSISVSTDPFSETKFSILCNVSSGLYSDIQLHFFNCIKEHKIFDISINGVDIIPLSIGASTPSISKANGYRKKESKFRFF